MSDWPTARPESYDETKTWDTANDVWSNDPAVLADTAARYRNYIIAIVEGDVIYFGEP